MKRATTSTKPTIHTRRTRQGILALDEVKWRTPRFSKLELAGGMAIAALAIALVETFIWLGSALAAA